MWLEIFSNGVNLTFDFQVVILYPIFFDFTKKIGGVARLITPICVKQPSRTMNQIESESIELIIESTASVRKKNETQRVIIFNHFDITSIFIILSIFIV